MPNEKQKSLNQLAEAIEKQRLELLKLSVSMASLQAQIRAHKGAEAPKKRKK
jgi:hypothetical protein